MTRPFCMVLTPFILLRQQPEITQSFVIILWVLVYFAVPCFVYKDHLNINHQKGNLKLAPPVTPSRTPI